MFSCWWWENASKFWVGLVWRGSQLKVKRGIGSASLPPVKNRNGKGWSPNANMGFFIVRHWKKSAARVDWTNPSFAVAGCGPWGGALINWLGGKQGGGSGRLQVSLSRKGLDPARRRLIKWSILLELADQMFPGCVFTPSLLQKQHCLGENLIRYLIDTTCIY